MKISYNLKLKQRIDLYLAEANLGFSREQIKKMIIDGKIYDNDLVVNKPFHRIIGEGLITIIVDERKEEHLPKWENEDLLEIIFENKDYLILNKPAGLTVHPVDFKTTDTLANLLVAKYGDRLINYQTNRPGIVHRLDKNTSGLLIVAKTEAFFKNIKQQFKERKVKKVYYGLIVGNFPQKYGKINLPIARDKKNRKKMEISREGKEAITEFKLLKQFQDFQLIEFRPLTGRTHQIRIHCKALKAPIYNDCLYGKRMEASDRHYLHAYQIGFLDQNNEMVFYQSPLPDYFQKKISESIETDWIYLQKG